MRKFNFTKNSIDSLPLPEKDKRIVYYDLKIPFLAIRVTSTGHKTFTLIRKINGRSEKITIGTYPAVTIEQARKLASIINGDVASGIDPSDRKKKLDDTITLGKMFEEYLDKHAKVYKTTWKSDVGYFDRHLKKLASKRINEIKKVTLQNLHIKVGESVGRHTANRLLEILSVMFSCAVDWGYCTDNPTKGIRHFSERSRDRFLQPDELPRFFKALDEETNTTIRDYIYLSLFTGARKANVVAMRWDEINFENKTWRIPKTKTGEPITIPLSIQALEILKSRQKYSGSSPYVFSSEKSKTGHLVEPKKGWKKILERANIKDLRLHDLRRSLGSWQASTGASLSVIGKTLGHKNVNTTAIYARLNLDPVRESVELATDAMMKAAKATTK